MFILGNLFIGLAKVADMTLTLFWWLILIRVIISWVNPDPFNTLVQLLYRLTDPVLQPFRRILPSMAIDISPILAFLAIVFLKTFLVSTLFDFGLRLR